VCNAGRIHQNINLAELLQHSVVQLLHRGRSNTSLVTRKECLPSASISAARLLHLLLPP